MHVIICQAEYHQYIVDYKTLGRLQPAELVGRRITSFVINVNNDIVLELSEPEPAAKEAP